MKYKFGQETETKKEDTYEEDEDKKQAQDLTNEEEKRHDEEMKKSFILPVSFWFAGAIKFAPLTPILSEPFLSLCPDVIDKVITCLSGVGVVSIEDDCDPEKCVKKMELPHIEIRIK